MTIPAPQKLPFDPWFMDNPLAGTSYIEKESFESMTPHEVMYRIATYRQKTIGGSETVLRYC
tara:strand:+ start:1487 stop:1672 length:186 start_codon:yes stop_codon:yes gene_type:complete